MTLQEFIQNIPLDKKEHFLLGALIGFPLVLLLGNIGGLIALVLFALKEIVHDKIQSKGKAEFLDFLYSAIPVFQYLIILNFI